MTELERLARKVERLSRKLKQAQKELDARSLRDTINRWSWMMHREVEPSEYSADLPVPRLQLEYREVDNGYGGAEWRYELIYRYSADEFRGARARRGGAGRGTSRCGRVGAGRGPVGPRRPARRPRRGGGRPSRR